MFDIISTAKCTQWNSFPTLRSMHTYSHVSNETVDFQVIPGKNCFVEFNKKFGFELLRTVNKDNKDIIQRIKKRQVDDLSCGAISKVSGGQIALGMTTGFIRMFNVQTGDFVPIKFKPDRIGNSVMGLDYSNTDEYLAAVYENYDINLFGLKTGIRTDTFRFEGLSTTVRFHPTRKFALAVGSYEGAITMMDIQTKKKLFLDKSAHDAPVREISMFDTSQDLFVSCGYDCNIKVFDLRKRTAVQTHKQAHPMSTVCISPCGTFCVAGNLKGDVISYDFRNMASPLDTKRLHDSAVFRVAFVPSVSSDSNISLEHTANTTNLDSTASAFGSTRRESSGRDSFAKFVDVCHYNNFVTTEFSTPKRRDSWSELMPTKNFHDFSTDSVAETPCLVSNETRSESMLNVQSRLSLNRTGEQDNSEHSVIIPVPVPEIRVHKPSEKKGESVIEPKRRRLTDAISLEGIIEEAFENEHENSPQNKGLTQKITHKEFSDGFAAYIKRVFDEQNDDANTLEADVNKQNHRTIADTEDDKENFQNNHQQRRCVSLAEPLTHMPNRRAHNIERQNGEMIMINANELNQMVNDRVGEILVTLETEFESHMRIWQDNVMKYMETIYEADLSDLRRRFHVQQQFDHQ